MKLFGIFQIVFLSVCLAAAAPAAASRPFVAWVERIDATGLTLQPLEMLQQNRVIVLPPSGVLVIGYFRSCMLETVTGGTVVIGAEHSTVAGGTVVRKRIACDPEALLTDGASLTAAGQVLRSTPLHIVVLHSRSPAFIVPPGTALTIGRTDGVQGKTEFHPDEGKRLIDLERRNVSLPPGEYVAEAAGVSVRFTIAPDAAVHGPYLSRTLHIVP